MHKLMKKIIAGLSLSAALCWNIPQVLAMPEIMPLSEVAEGMTGVAYTVVDASRELQSFDVRIIGTLMGGKGDPRYIMAEASGPLVEDTKGVIQGMSGSPVYIDGRLVGAASASFANLEHRTFLITPIEDMLQLWDYPDTKRFFNTKVVDLKAIAEAKAKKEAAEAENAKKKEAAASNQNVNGEATKNTADEGKNASGDQAVKPETLEKPGNATEAKEEKAQQQMQEEKAKKADQAEAKGAETKDNTAKPAEKTAAEAKTVADEKAKAEPTNAEVKKVKAEEQKDNDKAEKVKETQQAKESKAAEEAEPKTVLSASGFGSAGLSYLQSKLEPLGYKAEIGLNGNAKITTEYNATLEPGSAFSAALLCGDFTLGATGTVTAVDDKRMLGFGHAFLHRGNVNYFMTDAEIIGTVSSQTDGRKVANIGNIIGRINQDRSTGVAGILGVFPMIVPVAVKVEDSTLGRQETFRAMAAYDEDTFPAIMSSVGYASLARTTDDAACSTVKVHFVVKTNATEKGTVEHTNMFYADADVGQNSFNEVQNALKLIAGDTERQADIYGVSMDISSVAERKTATIVSVVPDKMSVKPGETVKFKIKLKPYRAENVTVEMPYTVPKARYEGPMTLDFHGGGLVSVTQLLAALQENMNSIDADKMITTAERLDKLEKAVANNEIVIEIGQPPEMSEKEQEKMIKRAIKAAKEAQANNAGGEEQKDQELPRLATDYVIENVAHATLQVEKP